MREHVAPLSIVFMIGVLFAAGLFLTDRSELEREWVDTVKAHNAPGAVITFRPALLNSGDFITEDRCELLRKAGWQMSVAANGELLFVVPRDGVTPVLAMLAKE